MRIQYLACRGDVIARSAAARVNKNISGQHAIFIPYHRRTGVGANRGKFRKRNLLLPRNRDEYLAQRIEIGTEVAQ